MCLTVNSKEVGVVRFQWVRAISLRLGEEEVLQCLEEPGRERYLHTHQTPLYVQYMNVQHMCEHVYLYTYYSNIIVQRMYYMYEMLVPAVEPRSLQGVLSL